MSDLNDIRRNKLEELMKLQQQSQEQAQVQQQIEQMESIVRQFLTGDALIRYGSIKAAHKEKALQLLVILFQAIQKGQVQSRIDDSTLKKVLVQLAPKKRDITIRRV